MPYYKLKIKNSSKDAEQTQKSQNLNNQYYFIARQQKLFLSKQFLIGSSFLAKVVHEKQNNKTIGKMKINLNPIFLNLNISNLTIQKIFHLFKGDQTVINRSRQMLALLRATQILGLSDLFNALLYDIKNNFDQYSFFTLLIISKQFNIDWLRKKCFRQLIGDNFEQMNFSRYDLIQCQEKEFRYILQIYYDLVIGGKCKGQPENILKQIIKQYQEATQIEINPQQYLTQYLQEIKQVDQIDSPDKLFSKNFSFEKAESLVDTPSSFSSEQKQEIQKNFSQEVKNNESMFLNVGRN